MAGPVDKPDNHHWQPLTVSEIAAVMRDVGIPWWIAGGWAIDLFLGRQTRPHGDIDILILRDDQLRVQRHLHSWHLYKTKQPTPSRLAPWPAAEFLDRATCIYDIWAKQAVDGPWRFQIMLMESKPGRWVFRRDARIGGPIEQLGWTTDDGLPVLQPAIQLLYKGKLEGRRAKDDADFAAVLPRLTPSHREWLATALRMQFGDRHPWLDELRT